MVINSSPDIEVEDVEDYRKEAQQFSHQVLVMKAMMKVLDLGAKELHSGTYDEIVDSHGRKLVVYKEDTRKAFIEGIKNCEMIMECDYDDDAKTKAKKLHDKLNEIRTNLMTSEKTDWERRTRQERAELEKKGIKHIDGFLNTKGFYWEHYIEVEVDIYRTIFSELNNLTKRLDFYQAEQMEG